MRKPTINNPATVAQNCRYVKDRSTHRGSKSEVFIPVNGRCAQNVVATTHAISSGFEIENYFPLLSTATRKALEGR